MMPDHHHLLFGKLSLWQVNVGEREAERFRGVCALIVDQRKEFLS
jgi:hypothetical protein